MSRSVFGKTLWDMRRVLVGWIVGIVAIGILYAAWYPLIRTPEYVELMESFAPDLMEAMGFDDITTPAGYLGSTTFGILGPILVIIFGTWLGIRSVAGDEDSGKLEVLLAHPVSRWRVVIERFGVLVVALLLACAALFVALVLVSGPAELVGLEPPELLAGSTHLAALGIVFGSLALAVGAATASRALAAGVVAVVGIVSYFGNTMASQIPEIGILRDLSPFHFYSGGRPLVNGFGVADLGVLAVAAVILVAIAGAAFDRRDVGV
jgi:ABC-2 type transport system permease protein